MTGADRIPADPDDPGERADPADPGEEAGRAEQAGGSGELMTELFDLRVTVDSIEGRSVCGMAVGDYFELTNSAELRIPAGRHFCLYALQTVLPLLPAKQRRLPSDDWLERDTLVCCPDPEERLIMRIDRTGRCRLRTEDLT